MPSRINPDSRPVESEAKIDANTGVTAAAAAEEPEEGTGSSNPNPCDPADIAQLAGSIASMTAAIEQMKTANLDPPREIIDMLEDLAYTAHNLYLSTNATTEVLGGDGEIIEKRKKQFVKGATPPSMECCRCAGTPSTQAARTRQ